LRRHASTYRQSDEVHAGRRHVVPGPPVPGHDLTARGLRSPIEEHSQTTLDVVDRELDGAGFAEDIGDLRRRLERIGMDGLERERGGQCGVAATPIRTLSKAESHHVPRAAEDEREPSEPAIPCLGLNPRARI